MTEKDILIVDDHPIVRQGLAQVLIESRVAGRVLQAHSIQSARDIWSLERPGVVVVDLALGEENGLDLVRELRRLAPDVRVLVLSMHDERDHAERCLRAGADGYVMKQTATEQLVSAVQRLQRGEIALSPAMQAQMVRQRISASAAPTGVDTLSDREKEILVLLGKGMSSAEIGERLHRSVKTIEAHRAAIRGKLGLRTAAELIRFATLWTSVR